MKRYAVPLVPGPTTVPQAVLDAGHFDFGSGDLEAEFFDQYARVEEKLRTVMRTRNRIAIMSGEAMVALWGALKSTLCPGDRVLSVATGVFGYGIAEMARTVTTEVTVVGFGYDEAADPERVSAAIETWRPKMLTMVHVETPSGVVNPVATVGDLVRAHGVPLFYVDAVAAGGGAELATDAWGIDLCLMGSQKCLSAPPGLGMVAASDRAWEEIEKTGYQGYDALAPFREALQRRWFPYTPCWQAIAGLEAACDRILSLGLASVIQTHAEVAAHTRRRLREMGLFLFPRREADCAPTVTAVRVPDAISWEDLDRRLRAEGVVMGGSIGPLAGRVFRIGHMGVQADRALVDAGLDALARILT
ncbi:MAG: aminotransferase class V-fold PLP-dependent enzyme [Desulfobacteraceae bacterium]|jgi:aspartate aminotransferase-like enzyme|nr:aminotransferase class V-fold PLP-dependent enzyme [Desulfobacteraceae bacterium]